MINGSWRWMRLMGKFPGISSRSSLWLSNVPQGPQHEPAPTSMKKRSPFVSVPACTTNVCFFMCRLPLDRMERSRPFWGKRGLSGTRMHPSHECSGPGSPLRQLNPYQLSSHLLPVGRLPPGKGSQTVCSQHSYTPYKSRTTPKAYVCVCYIYRYSPQ